MYVTIVSKSYKIQLIVFDGDNVWILINYSDEV